MKSYTEVKDKRTGELTVKSVISAVTSTASKVNVTNITLAAICAGLSAYFQELLIPLAILLAVMVLDYISGLTKGWITKSLSSQIGLIGIIKKLCYLIVVCVAGVVDWIIQNGLASAGIEIKPVYFFGLVVVIWLIINELISILENLGTIGVPLPAFLIKLVSKLKNTVESKTDEILDDTEGEV